MLRRLLLVILVVVVVVSPAGQARAAGEERGVRLEGQIGPYWERQGMHVDGSSVKGSVVLRANESWARVYLEIEDRSVGASAGYQVLFCPEACGLDHQGPVVARAGGMGPFALTFPLDDLKVLHYRISVDEGVRVDAHVSGSLVLMGGEEGGQDLAEASTPTMQDPYGASRPATAWAVAVGGAFLVAPAVVPRLRRWLSPAPLLGLFTRRETLLDHPVRRRIHQAIRAAPGIHLRELRREMAMPPGQVDHHLQKLVQGGYVVTHAVRGYTAHFLPGAVDRSLMAALARVKSDAARSLLALIAEGECVTLGVAADRMGIAISTASYHVGALERLGLVEVRENGHRRWRITALGRSFLDLVDRGPGSGSRNGPESA